MNGKMKTLKPIRAQFRAARGVCLHAAVAAALVIPPTAFKQPTSSFITLPMSSLPAVVMSAENLFADRASIFSKSSAQVALPVAPKMVQPAACELKLGSELSGKRSHPLGVRFSVPELAFVKAKAKAAGCSTNGYIRTASLGADYIPPHDPEWTKALLASNRELTRQGNNLNQITHKRNARLIDEAQTDSLLGIMARAYLQTHKAVRVATPDMGFDNHGCGSLPWDRAIRTALWVCR